MPARDVAITQGANVDLMNRRAILQPEKLARFVRGGGTPNQRMMAAAAALRVPSLRKQAAAVALTMLERDLLEGPASPELLPPYPHGDMYEMAYVSMIESALLGGDDVEEISHLAAVVLGRELRLGDLVAEPGAVMDLPLPGARAPLGAAMARRSMTQCWAVTRGREGVANAVLRGTGGDVRRNPDRDTPAWWLRKILEGPLGPGLLAGPLSREASLPPTMRLPLAVWRWDGGTLAAFSDPATEALFRAQLKAGQEPEPGDFEKWRAETVGRFLAKGSKAAGRQHRPEPVVDWIRAEWSLKGRARKVTVGENWTTPVPTPTVGASVVRIPGPPKERAVEPDFGLLVELARQMVDELAADKETP